MADGTSARFQQRVEETLHKAKIQFVTKPFIAGLRPDILVTSPDGRVTIVETKVWKATPENIARARQQVRLYREATRSSRAFVVLKSLKRSLPKKGVVRRRDLPALLRSAFSSTEVKGRQGAIGKARGMVFAAMPFSPSYGDVYFVAMAQAAKESGLECRRVDRQEFEGDIVDEIKRMIRESRAVIADLSGGKPNVLYEVGFAHALGRPTIHICSGPLSKLPFDVRNWRTLEYKRGQTHRLARILAKRLRAVLRKDD
jgi:hypothetical protein